MSWPAEVKAAPDANNPLSLLAQLSHGPRLRRAMTWYAVGAAGWQASKKAQNWWRTRNAYVVSVKSSDDIYDDVHECLSTMIPERDRRALLAVSFRGRTRSRAGQLELAVPDDGRNDTPRTRLATFYDGKTSQTVDIAGHRVTVQVDQDSLDLGALGGGDRIHRSERLKFTVHSEPGRDAVLTWLAGIAESRNEAELPRFFMMSRWGGGWDRRTDLTPRSIDSVVLRAGQIEALVADVGRFLGWRDQYMRFGIPYHRGYLFHGPPGTGKTSLAKAVAQHFGLDVYYAPLSDLDKDTNLLHLVAQVKAGSVLLLEDIDVLHAATHRDDDTKGVSLSGLLNALDGVSTPSGIITIMTTNHREVLDEALIRPGRVDREELIDYLDDEQLARLVATIGGNGAGSFARLNGGEITPAEVLELVKRHMDEPADALHDIDMLIKERARI